MKLLSTVLMLATTSYIYSLPSLPVNNGKSVMDDIAKINSASELPNVMEVDEMMTPEQIKHRQHGVDTIRTRRGLPRDDINRWPNAVIDYTISSSFSLEEEHLIESSMKEVMAKTCIHFKRHEIGSAPYAHVRIQPGQGCGSYIGKTGFNQELTLQTPGCVYKSIIIHELLHALGVYHEQARADRDQYVKIMTANILTGMEDQFEKMNTDSLGVPYDPHSIMHYKNDIFSNGNGPTMVWRADESLDLGGDRLTASDVMQLKRFYECENIPKTNKKSTTTTTVTTNTKPSSTTNKSVTTTINFSTTATTTTKSATTATTTTKPATTTTTTTKPVTTATTTTKPATTATTITKPVTTAPTTTKPATTTTTTTKPVTTATTTTKPATTATTITKPVTTAPTITKSATTATTTTKPATTTTRTKKPATTTITTKKPATTVTTTKKPATTATMTTKPATTATMTTKPATTATMTTKPATTATTTTKPATTTTRTKKPATTTITTKKPATTVTTTKKPATTATMTTKPATTATMTTKPATTATTKLITKTTTELSAEAITTTPASNSAEQVIEGLVTGPKKICADKSYICLHAVFDDQKKYCRKYGKLCPRSCGTCNGSENEKCLKLEDDPKWHCSWFMKNNYCSHDFTYLRYKVKMKCTKSCCESGQLYDRI